MVQHLPLDWTTVQLGVQAGYGLIRTRLNPFRPPDQSSLMNDQRACPKFNFRLSKVFFNLSPPVCLFTPPSPNVDFLDSGYTGQCGPCSDVSTMRFSFLFS